MTAGNTLYYGDNLDVLREHMPTESVDLVYLDPPFNSNRNYNVLFGKASASATSGDAAQIQAFGDTWVWTSTTEEQYTAMMAGQVPSKVADALGAMRTLVGENDALAYLVNMAPRIVELYRVLKPTGSMWLHCDPTMSHYLKILLDATFGPVNFRNEVIWRRTSVKGDARMRLGRNHDVLLYFAKGATPTFNAQTTEHSDEYRARFRFDDNDGRGPYRDGPLDSPNPRPNLTYVYKGYPPPDNGWRVNLAEMERLDAEDRLMFPRKADQRIARKLYLSERDGVPMGDVWTDISPINSQAAERLGYPTQKPVALMERIITASSDEGDVVLDPFCGCGTTIDAAIRLNRRWLGIDITYIAVDLIEKRLRHTHGEDITTTYKVLGIPRDIGGARALFAQSPFDFERWTVSLVSAQPNEKQVGDKGIDGVARFPVDGKGNVGRALVSVKGGKIVGPQAVRDLLGTVETQKAQMGVLITMADLTKGVLDAVHHGGMYTWPVNGQMFPRVQAITVAELLKGKRPAMPPMLLPYIAAAKRVKAVVPEGLF